MKIVPLTHDELTGFKKTEFFQNYYRELYLRINQFVGERILQKYGNTTSYYVELATGIIRLDSKPLPYVLKLANDGVVFEEVI